MNHPSSHPLQLFRINAGSCNGCDVELAATEAVRWFDVAALGCAYAHSPAEADIVLVTGPLTARVREQVVAAYAEVPEPKVTVAIGVCPVSCGVFRDSYAVDGPVDRCLPVDINVPGCPPRPQAILAGIAEAVMLWNAKTGRHAGAPALPAFAGSTPERLRGRPRFEATSCVGCRMCVHVCAGGAIRVAEEQDRFRFTLWENSCVFCGLCAHYCPTGALTMGRDWRMTHRQEGTYSQVATGDVPYAPCSGCGEPFQPAVPELMRRAFRGSGSDIEKLRSLCPECRLSLTVAAARGVKR